MLALPEIELILRSGDREAIEHLYLAACHPYYGFEPRPDDPNNFEEQASFCEAGYRFDEQLNRFVYDEPAIRFKICLGGTGSGKTVAAAWKTAKHVMETRPPEHGAKFWVISHSMEQVGAVCWKEKLQHMIPENEIYSIAWHNQRRGFPSAVLLKLPDDYTKVGWVLEFKSYEQGLTGFTGANIGGFWFNEEVPFALVAEVMGRTRQWGSPGWADFTPIECRDQEWPEKYNQPPADWRFYHLNSQLNYHNAPGWYESQKAHWPEDTIELRTIGKFTALHGAVFKEFRQHVHVINWDQFHELTGKWHIPREWAKRRGMDFGHNNPTCCLWGARNKDGVWFIYDEYYRAQASIEEHAAQIKKRDWDDSLPWFGPTYTDHDAQVRDEYGRLGIACTMAVKQQSKAIDYVRSLMMLQGNERPKLYILEECRNLLRELPAWRWKEGTDGRDPKDEPIDKDDHSCDALLYMVYSDFMSYQTSGKSGFRKKPDYISLRAANACNPTPGFRSSRSGCVNSLRVVTRYGPRLRLRTCVKSHCVVSTLCRVIEAESCCHLCSAVLVVSRITALIGRRPDKWGHSPRERILESPSLRKLSLVTYICRRSILGRVSWTTFSAASLMIGLRSIVAIAA